MSVYLLADFGSTFTKLTLVDLEKEAILATSSSFTTVLTDITLGYEKALNKLEQKLGKKIVFDCSLACSSANGGLKMAAIGLVEELTTEAAKRVCLGAGAKVEVVFSHHLTKAEVNKLESLALDIILLAGGTDGGNDETVIFNAQKLANSKVNVPIVFAGNKNASDTVTQILKDANKEFYICENVMPKINKLNVTDAKKRIQALFIEKIIEAKGIKKIEKKIDHIIFPTPTAVLKAAELLAKGYGDEDGLGDLVIVDIGGATTDIYSLADGLPKKLNTILAGLEEPFAKRTVEGDLGMRYSASGILNVLSQSELEKAESMYDLKAQVNLRTDNVNYVPNSSFDYQIDSYIAKVCINTAFSRHVGTYKDVFTQFGTMFYQLGKDLTDTKYVIGTGGALIHSKDPSSILSVIKESKEKVYELRPKKPKYMLDHLYILSAMGLLAEKEPLKALRIMKKQLKLLGE